MNAENSVLTRKLGEGLLKSLSNPPPKLALLAIVLLGLALRTYPLFLESFPDPDYYYHLRMARLAYEQGGIPSYDALSYAGRPYTYYPLHHLLVARIANATGLSVDVVLPAATLLFAAAAIAAVYLLAKKLFGEKAGLLAGAAAAIHAGLIARSAAFSRPDEYALLLIPFSLLLLLENGNKKIYFGLSALFAFFPLVHLPAALVGLFVFLACALACKASWNKIAAAFAGFLVGAAYYAGWNLAELLSSKGFAASAELVSFDFSFIVFYSGIFLVFGAIGALGLLEKNNFGQASNRLLLAWLAVTSALQLAANRNVVFFAPALCVAAGEGLRKAFEKSGEYEKYLVAIILAALAVGTYAFLSVQQAGFTRDDVEAAEWLGANSAGGVVAAHWDRGHLLTFYGSNVLADGYFEYAPDPERKVAALEEMLATPNAGRALQLAVQNGVEFVFLDEKSVAELPENSVWRSAPAGFEKAFENKAQVWRLKENA